MVAPMAPAMPRYFIGVEGTNSRLIKPRNMHIALQNEGAAVRFTAFHTAPNPCACRSSRMRFQLKVKNTIGESVMTKTIVERLAVSGPMGIWANCVAINVAAPESAQATNVPRRIHPERKIRNKTAPKMPAAARLNTRRSRARLRATSSAI